MTARSFGRKNVDGAAPAPPRIGLVAGRPRSFQPMGKAQPPGDDELEARRAAFVSEERARSEGSAEDVPEEAREKALRAFKVEARLVPTDRSLKLAYALWFLLGLAGAHRLYLRRPLTGGLQAALFTGCWAATALEYYWAFGGLALSCLWMIADGFLIERLHRTSGRD
jgi:TM2 domain-containing membrane protein YozV